MSGGPVGRRRRRRLTTADLVKAYIWLLFLIPTRLHLIFVGGIAGPSTILAVMLLITWTVSTLAPSLKAVDAVLPVRIVLALFGVSALLSYGYMNRHSIPSDQLANSDRLMFSYVCFAGVALCIAEGLRNMDEIRSIIRHLLAATASMCLVAALQFKLGIDLTLWVAKVPILASNGALNGVFGRDGFNRPAGTASHPIEFGVVVGTVLAFALFALVYDTTWKRSRRYISFALILVGVPMAISRSALLAAVIAFASFLVGTTRQVRRSAGVVFFVFLTFIFMAVPGLLGTLKGFVFAGGSDSSIVSRTSDYAAVSGYLRSSPWIGRGPGSFIPSLRVLDNQYLLTLIESGLVGFVLLLALYSLPTWLGRGGRLRSSTLTNANLGQAFAGAGLSIVFASATYDAFSFPMFTSVVALIIGLSGAYWRLTKTGEELLDAPPVPSADVVTRGERVVS